MPVAAGKDPEHTERGEAGGNPAHGRAAEARAYRQWTTREVAILGTHYPLGGARACAPLLPRRSPTAIQNKARALGLRAPRSSPRRRRWATSEAIDAQIRLIYRSAPRKRAVMALAERIGRPRWWVTKRARQLGLIAPRFKEPDWSSQELALLARHAHKSDEVIARIFRQAGFMRSATAIHVKRKRLKLTEAEGRHDAGLYSAGELAMLLGVDAKTVTRWIAHEGLPAIRRGTARRPAQGGDEWEIDEVKLRPWMRDHAQLIDLRKVDRYWFIGLAFCARA